jgi:hypothetical protein
MKQPRKTHIVLFVLLLIVMTTVLLEGLDFSYLSLAWVVIISAPVSLVLWILARVIKISPKFYILTLGILSATVLAFFVSEPIRDIQNSLSKKEGDKIITALELYKLNNSKYPKELIELTLDYLFDIPKPKTGVFLRNNFFYNGNTEEFLLGFRSVCRLPLFSTALNYKIVIDFKASWPE